MTGSHPDSARHFLGWNLTGRLIIFTLAASSIACLLVEFYGLCPMRPFTLAVFVPSMLVLSGIALWDWRRGKGKVANAIWIGAVAGFVAAIAYDIFRLPFVFSREWGLSAVVPPLNLFKVFPRFGAMILGQPLEQTAYSLTTHLVGWAYHFSNGITFGVMYMAMIGRGGRSWLWAVLFAAGLELAMLLTPYPGMFGIKVSPTFVTVTLTAHVIFGVVLGICVRRFASVGIQLHNA